MAETETPDGASDSPGNTSDTDFKPLEVEVNSVADLGKALTAEADHFGEAAKNVKEKLTSQADGERGTDADVPVGVDPTQETLRQVAGMHTQSMTDMTTHLDNVETGLRNLGLITQVITSQFGNQDGLNSAEVGQVGDIMYSDSPLRGVTNSPNREVLGDL